MEGKIHICPHCKKEFIATRSSHLYCCNYCRVAFKASQGASRICQYCGNSFIPKHHSLGIFCSHKCRSHHYHPNNGITEGKALCYKISVANKIVIRLIKEIRRIDKYTNLKCKQCGNTYNFIFKSNTLHYCCDECRLIAYKDMRNRYRKTPRGKQLLRAQRLRIKAQRRAKEHDIHAERINPFDVFNRDKWICQLCGVRTLKTLRGKHHDLSPELDHIIPLSKGGWHTWSNVQCTCRKCNHTKSDKMYGQLRIAM